MNHAKADYYAVWRLKGENVIHLPLKNSRRPEILYQTDLGIEMEAGNKVVSLKFPKPDMAVIIKVAKE